MKFLTEQTALLAQENKLLRTILEAHKSWCPFASSRVVKFTVTGPDGTTAEGQSVMMREETRIPEATCLADACMAWRWTERQTLHRYGYCGIAGHVASAQ